MLKTHNSVYVIFGAQVFAHSVGVNSKFVPIRTKSPLPTPNRGKFNTKYNMGYYRQS